MVPIEKADGYAEYLAESDLGVRGYRAIPGNRGASLLRRVEGRQTHFVLISYWESVEAIRRYAGTDMEKARYFPYDLACLVEPEPKAEHFEVLADGGTAPAIERALRLAVPRGLW